MNRKKSLIAAACITMAALLLCGTFAATWWVVANAKSGQLGGLVGEMLAGKDKFPQLFPDQTAEQETEEQETVKEDPAPLPYAPIFYYDAADIQDALMMGELQEDGAYLSLTVDNTWKDYQASLIPMDSSYAGVTCIVIVHRTNHVKTQGSFGIAARAESNDIRDVSFTYFTRDDYSYAFWRSSLVEIGGLFQDNPHNYISYLSYEPFVNKQNGQTVDVAFIAGFASIEDAEAYLDHTEAPGALADAAYLADMINSQSANGIESFKFWEPDREDNGVYPLADNGHVSVYPKSEAVNSGFTVYPYTGEVYSTGARYLAIKCRRWGPDAGEILISSSSPENGAYVSYQYTAGDWQLIIIDLAYTAVNDTYDVEYLYFQFFNQAAEQGRYFEVAWIGTFQSIYAAQKYDEMHPYSKG